MANSVDTSQTALSIAVWSELHFFAYVILSESFVYEHLGHLRSLKPYNPIQTKTKMLENSAALYVLPMVRYQSWYFKPEWQTWFLQHVRIPTVIICIPLRKHAYSNIKKISLPKTENYQIKSSDSFHMFARNIDCGYSPRRGGSNEYPQSMFLSRNKKNNVYPRKPQFYYIKVGFKGVNIV